MTRATFALISVFLFACSPESGKAPTPDSKQPATDDGPKDGNAEEKTNVNPEPSTNQDTAQLGAAPAKSLAAATNRFGTDLYGELRGEPGNIVISPASIEIALLMTWGGAKEDTKAEMAKVLHLGELGDGAHASAGQMLTAWNDPARTTYELAVANRIFTEKTAPIEAAFVELNTRHYGAGFEPVDFRNDYEPSRKHINAWVEKQTKDRIKDLLPEGSLDELTRLVLTNAVYFLGKWEHRFDEANTKDAPFFVDGKSKVSVPTMHETTTFSHAALDGLSVLEMPYVGKELAMVVVLPTDKNGLDKVEQRLVAGELDSWIQALASKKAEVALPRFRIEMPKSILLKPHLETLGMPIAFTDTANFEAMSNPPNPAEKLKIADVYHKAFVEVNEEGTEAAAATAVVMVARGAATAPKNERFIADHPFLFAIRDLRNGAILFLGRVSDPRPSP